MQADHFDRYKFNYLTSLYLIILLSEIILIVDTAKPMISVSNRQMCTKIQSMLSNGKYQTHQMPSNVTYVSRVYAQNFLAYSPLDDILIFVEPKHQLHVYNAPTVELIVNITTTDVIYAASCLSLSTGDRHDICFVYESRIKPNLVSIRVCEVQFNTSNLNFEDQNCIETLTIPCDQLNIRINGFTIKHDHDGTKKSILFLSTDMGLIYTVYDMHTRLLIQKPVTLNDTLSEGSVVVTSSGTVYYANKAEHTIHEIHITHDFRIRYGKILKSNAIRSPFGLIIDECDHLYVATKSMILVMFIQTYKTIRSIFLKASDLPITMERLNSTTYVYITIRKSFGTTPSMWMFNFLYFTEVYKPVITTQHPVVHMDKTLAFSGINTDTTTLKMSEHTHTSSIVEEESSSTDITTLTTHSLSTEQPTSMSSSEFQENSFADSPHFNNSSLLNEVYLTTQPSSDQNTSELWTSDFQGKVNASLDENTLLQTNLTQQLTTESNLSTQHINYSIGPLETVESNTQNLNSVVSFTTSHTTVHETDSSIDNFDKYLDIENTQQNTDIYEEKSTFSSPLSTDDSSEHSLNIALKFDVTQSNFLPSEKYSTTDRPTTDVLNTDIILPILSSNLDQTEPTQVLSNVFTENTTRLSDINHSSSHSILLSTSSEQSVSLIHDEHIHSSSLTNNDMVIFTIPQETNSLQNQSHSTSTESINNHISDDFYNESQMITYEPINIIQNSTLTVIVTDSINKKIEDRNSSQNDSSSMSVTVTVSSTLHTLSSFIVSSVTLIPSRSSHVPSPLRSSLSYASMISTKIDRLLLLKHFSAPATTNYIPGITVSSSISTIETSKSTITSDTTQQSSTTTFSDKSSSRLLTSYSTHTSIASPLQSTTTDDQLTSQSSNTFVESSLMYAISSESSTTDYETSSTMVTISTNLDSSTTTQTDESSTFLLRTTDYEENLSTIDFLSSETTLVSSTISSPITDPYSEQYISTKSLSKTSSTVVLPSIDERISTLSLSEVTSTFSPPVTDEYTSTQSSLEVPSTTFSNIYNSKTEHATLIITTSPPRSSRPARRRTSRLTTSTTIAPTTITTIDPYRTRQQKITRLISRPSTTTTITSLVQITSIYDQFLTSSLVSIWYSKLNLPEKQHRTVIKPSLDTNASNTLLSNELLNTLFNNTSNSSTEKSIYFNLVDLPPSSWNLSLHTNDSILLDIALPSNSHTTTNLTITNIEANRFSAKILGVPVNLQVDEIQVKQFSLTMNLTNNQTNQSLSDVVIGHIKSEQFTLDITKSDNMNLNIKQVDSDTAEIFFDDKFCTNETNLQINLNLSKNGTIRYGNRTPIRIGPVFTRVHMLKQSCDLEQPFAFFFDICQAQNPCLNGGTCESHTPNYDNSSYSDQHSSEINYQCLCPRYISGEHCQYSRYPFGYCINGGSLSYTLDINNKSIEKCLCTQGFRGHHCENNIDDCIGIRCSNHGLCLDGINTYKCSCFEGFYGNDCEQTNTQTVILQVVRKSFATVAILLIACIAGLAVASDIHTYLTRKKQIIHHKIHQFPRATSELFENSVLLLAFSDAPIEMTDLSTVNRRKKTTTTTTMKQHPVNRKKQTSYQHLPNRKYRKTLPNMSAKHHLLPNPSDETIL